MANTGITDTRQYDLDFVRIISICAVIVIHGFAGAVLTKSVDTSGWITANTVDSFARWAVPVFIMLSGALLIKPVAKLEAKTFFRKRFSHILIPLIVWPVIYTIWYACLQKSPPEWNRLILDFLSGVSAAPHLYFLFIIAGLYLITPFINIIRHAITQRQFLIVSVVLLGATTLWYTLESFLPGHYISLNAVTQFVPYIGYFMLGAAIKDFKFKYTATPIVLFFVIAIAMATSTYALSVPSGASNGLFFYSYFSILTIIMSPLAFFSLKSIYNLIVPKLHTAVRLKVQKILITFSNATFSVYLIHMIVLGALIAHIPKDPMGVKGSLLFTTLTIIISFVASLIIVKIPYIRRLVS